jgi:hypothetical protein
MKIGKAALEKRNADAKLRCVAGEATNSGSASLISLTVICKFLSSSFFS